MSDLLNAAQSTLTTKRQFLYILLINSIHLLNPITSGHFLCHQQVELVQLENTPFLFNNGSREETSSAKFSKDASTIIASHSLTSVPPPLLRYSMLSIRWLTKMVFQQLYLLVLRNTFGKSVKITAKRFPSSIIWNFSKEFSPSKSSKIHAENDRFLHLFE